jgi:tetratricopeptide (TPR) repeat protein
MMRRFRSFHDNWEDPEMWRQVRTALARYSKALELAEQAAAKPKCRFRIEWAKPLDYSDSQYMHLRYLCRLATARAVMHAKDGNMDQAVESIKLILRMSESMKDEPSLASRMVRYGAIQNATDAVEAVALYGGIDETRARRLCELLAAVDLRDSAAKGLAGERAVGIVIYDRIRSGRMPKWASDRDPDDIVGRMRGILPSGWVLGSDEIYYLKQMRKQIDAAACPYRELAPRIRGAQPDPPRFAIVSAVIVPWGMRAISTRDRAIARLAGGRIFLGLVAYHSRYGAYPRTLEQLRSRLGWRVAPDPFSGKDFVYRRKGAGFLLYSLGEDLRDGGGLDARMGGMGDIVWTRDR